MDGVLTIVKNSGLASDALRELRDTILRELAEGNTQAAAQAATDGVPGIAERFAPKNATELAAYLSLLVAIISMVIAMKNQPTTPQINITNNNYPVVVRETGDHR